MLYRWVPLQASEDITVSGASSASTAAPAETTTARVCATQDCRIIFDDGTPVATATSMLLPAGTVEFIPMCAGQKVAAIQEAVGGKCNVTFGKA